MIYYKFSTCINEPLLSGTVHRLFQGSYEDTWLDDSDILDMIQTVEQSEFIGNGWLRSLSGVDYRVYDMSDGLQTLLLAYHQTIPYFKFDALGINLYPYLGKLFKSKDVHFLGTINPYICSLPNTYEFPPIFMEDFGVEINSAEEFSYFYEQWCTSTSESFAGLYQYTLYNSRLPVPVLLKHDYTPKYKQYPSFRLELTHKITFLQGDSASGKSYFFQTLLELQSEFGYVNNDWFMIALENRMHIQRLLEETRNTIILVDVDKMSVGMEALTDLLSTPSNILVIFVGHWFTSRFRVSLDCLYDVKFNRHAKCISFSLKWLPDYFNLTDYTDIVVEDSGSGQELFLNLFHGALVHPAGGYMRVSSEVNRLHFDSKALVVLDYSTSEVVIPKLIQAQNRRTINILVASSAEYYILVGLGLMNEYTSVLKYLAELSYVDLKKYLSYVGKTVITVETLDLLAFTIILRKYKQYPIAPGSKSQSILELLDIDYSLVLKAIQQDILRNSKVVDSSKEDSTNYFI